MNTATKLSPFAADTLKGLSSPDKYLLAKHFYDDNGSRIFQKIMHMPEYYLMRSEYEIFLMQGEKISDQFIVKDSFIKLIELGPGDGLKSRILLKNLIKKKSGFIYMPVDISSDAVKQLVDSLQKEHNGILIKEHIGDYFKVMATELNENDSVPKVILFLGANIGNFHPNELEVFMGRLSSITNKGDKVLIGFDLKKDPSLIVKAYDDPHGHTRDFNLNHLERINRELNANFKIDQFRHHCSYDPHAGTMRSYLVCQQQTNVFIEALNKDFHFREWESIFMELSRKYDLHEITRLASDYGFMVQQTFTDSKGYFVDSLWEKM